MELTIARVPTIAVNIDVIIPIANVMANPLTGPLPTTKRMIAAINVVMFASAMVDKALS